MEDDGVCFAMSNISGKMWISQLIMVDWDGIRIFICHPNNVKILIHFFFDVRFSVCLSVCAHLKRFDNFSLFDYTEIRICDIK